MFLHSRKEWARENAQAIIDAIASIDDDDVQVILYDDFSGEIKIEDRFPGSSLKYFNTEQFDNPEELVRLLQDLVERGLVDGEEE